MTAEAEDDAFRSLMFTFSVHFYPNSCSDGAETIIFFVPMVGLSATVRFCLIVMLFVLLLSGVTICYSMCSVLGDEILDN